MPINDGISYPVSLHKFNKALKRYFPMHRVGTFAITKRGRNIWTSLLFELEDGERYRVNLPISVVHQFHSFYGKYRGRFPGVPPYIAKKRHRKSYLKTKDNECSQYIKNNNNNINNINNNNIENEKIKMALTFTLNIRDEEVWEKFRHLVKARTEFRSTNHALWAHIEQQVKKWEELDSA